MSMADHLRELRRRLFISLIAVAVAIIPAWFLYPWLVEFLNEPYCTAQLALDAGANCDFLETDIVEPFSLRIRIAGWGAVILAMPVILWQLWRFIAPGLYKKERRYAFAFVGSATVLFVLGAALAYFTLTRATEFLINVAGDDVEVRAGIASFTRLALFMMVAFGIGFQFPVVMVALQIVGLVTPQQLSSWRRQVILLIFVLAAGITPSGDPFSLFALAIPMYLLFELSILIGRFWLRRRTKREAAEDAAQKAEKAENAEKAATATGESPADSSSGDGPDGGDDH